MFLCIQKSVGEEASLLLHATGVAFLLKGVEIRPDHEQENQTVDHLRVRQNDEKNVALRTAALLVIIFKEVVQLRPMTSHATQ